MHFDRRGKTTDIYSERVRQKTSAKVNTLLTSTLVMVPMHSSAFAVTLSDNIAQLLGARAETPLALSIAVANVI